MEIRFNDQADARLERGEINSVQCQRLKRGNITHLLQLAYYPSPSRILSSLTIQIPRQLISIFVTPIFFGIPISTM